MTRRLITLALAFAILSCASQTTDRPTPAQLAEQASVPAGYSSQGGDKPVGVIPDGILRDAKRGKDIEVSIEYPIAAGSYPLIIWSHGFGASSRGYVGLSSFWASYGYVVIKPTHADSGKLAGMKTAEEVWEAQTAADWRNRVQDVTAILDALPELEEKYPELKGKIDAAHIGVGGHSYGAHTAILAGGAKTFPGGTSYADPRVKAVLAMSPQGPSEIRGLTSESFATITPPTLFMTGSRDEGISDQETPQWRRQAFELSPAGDKYLVVLEGARNATFGGRIAGMAEGVRTGDVTMPSTLDPNDPRGRLDPTPRSQTRSSTSAKRDPQLMERNIFARARVISVAFWDAYLHGNPKGKEYLEKLAGRTSIELVKK